MFQPLNPDLPGDRGFTAGQAAAIALSPDGRTLLILTSGYNRIVGPDGKHIPAALERICLRLRRAAAAPPIKRAGARPSPNTFLGLAWAPCGRSLLCLRRRGRRRAGVRARRRRPLRAPARTFKLGHQAGLGLAVKPEAAGLAVSPDGAPAAGRQLPERFGQPDRSRLGGDDRARPAAGQDRSREARPSRRHLSAGGRLDRRTTAPGSRASATARSIALDVAAAAVASAARVARDRPAERAAGGRPAAGCSSPWTTPTASR